MENAMLTTMIIGLIIGSAFGGLILWPLAKGLGKVSNAKYGNSFWVCFISSVINFGIWYLLGTEVYQWGFETILLLNILILSIAYILIGKIIWKSSWLQSFKANIIWIIVYASFMGYSLSQFNPNI